MWEVVDVDEFEVEFFSYDVYGVVGECVLCVIGGFELFFGEMFDVGEVVVLCVYL